MFLHTRSSAPKRFAKFGWQTRTFCHKKVAKVIGCSRNYSAERRFTPDADQSGSAGKACALPGSHIHTWQKEAFKPPCAFKSRL